jgi:hypothetical protein
MMMRLSRKTSSAFSFCLKRMNTLASFESDIAKSYCHSLDAGDGVFDLLGDLRFELCWACAELRDHNRYNGNIDIRHPRDGSLWKLTIPIAISAVVATIGGSGFRIDHAETLSAINILRAIRRKTCPRYRRGFAKSNTVFDQRRSMPQNPGAGRRLAIAPDRPFESTSKP